MPIKQTTIKAIDTAMDNYYRDIAIVARNNAVRSYISGDIKASKLLGIDISFDLVQKEALEYSKDYGELLYREGASVIQGKKIPWLKDRTGQTRENVFKTIKDGLKEGKPVSEIGGKKLGKGTIAYDLKKIMGAEDSGMVRIARTEVARIQSAGSMTRYRANGIKKFKWLCGGDPCPICAQYCNKIFNIDDMPEIPVHPNCTCDKAPVIER